MACLGGPAVCPRAARADVVAGRVPRYARGASYRHLSRRQILSRVALTSSPGWPPSRASRGPPRRP
eukprot:7115732-Lingulodinium_polyedra.AAC.1